MINTQEIMEGLRISGIGMGVVFLFLIILTILIKLLKRMNDLKKSPDDTLNEVPEDGKVSAKHLYIEQNEETQEMMVKEKMVAAISAAIATHLGKKRRKLNIKPLIYSENVSKEYNAWSMAGRQELLSVRQTLDHDEYTVII